MAFTYENDMKLFKFYRTVFWLVLLMPAMAQAQEKKVMNLETYKWENRLLLLFAPDKMHADFVRQIEINGKNKQGVKERQLKVLELVPGGNAAGMRQDLLQQFNVQPGSYTLLLLGKDGLEKYRSQQPVQLETIFGIIDQMPMRRQEMRKQNEE